MLGTTKYKEFEEMFPELNDNPKIVCSNADNIRIKLEQSEAKNKKKKKRRRASRNVVK